VRPSRSAADRSAARGAWTCCEAPLFALSQIDARVPVGVDAIPIRPPSVARRG
jgi:hypothetical protein